MKSMFRALSFSFLVLFAGVMSMYAGVPAYINRIEGQVYDPNRIPAENLNVELLNDVDAVFSRTRTNGAGRFSFSGMPSGRYMVRVLTFGTNFMEQTQEVQITKIGRSDNDTAYVDFYLRNEKRNGSAGNETSRDVIFVQEIPAAAKKLYQEGISDFGKDPVRGLTKVRESIRIFPEYYDALNWLGKAYISRKEFAEAYPYLLKALDINTRNYSTYYSLGFAFYQLKQYPAALQAARASTVLAPDSIDTELLYGTILRITGNYPDSEKTLLKANSLAKNMNSDVHWQLALLFNRINRNQETVSELEAYLKLVPDCPDRDRIQDMIAKLKPSQKH